MLACRPDARELGVLIGLGAHEVGGGGGVVAPDRRGVADLDVGVLDPQIDGLGRFALDDERVVPGILELGAE